MARASDPTNPTGTTPPAGTSPPGDTTGDGGPAPECKVPVDVTPPMANNIGLVNGIVASDLSGAHVELRPSLDIVKGLQSDENVYFFKPGYGYIGPRLFKLFCSLVFTKAGFNMNLRSVRRATNGDMVPAAGEATLTTIKTVPVAAVMGIAPEPFERDLNVLSYYNEWLDAVQWIPDMVLANRNQAEDKVATTIENGVKAVKGLLPGDFLLRSSLGKALTWLGWNPAAADATRKDHKKLIEKLTEHGGTGGGTAGPAAGTGGHEGGTPPAGTGSGTGTPPSGQTGTPGTSGQPTGTPPPTPPKHRLPRKPSGH